MVRIIGVLWVFVALGFGCGDSPPKKSGTANVGGLNQACFPNSTCNAGLECVENRCVSISSNNTMNTNNANNTNNISNNSTISPNNQSNNNPNNPTNNSNNNSNNPNAICGNQVIESGEACDGNQLGGNTCVGLGFEGGGTLRCASDCLGFDTSDCFRSRCGNGRVDSGEVCDGNLLNGNSCASLGFVGGTLRCNSSCDGFDSSGCQRATCGDGVIQVGEDCDGANLQGLTCTNYGYDGGTLRCTNNCTIDLSLCTSSSFTCEIVLPSGGCAANDPASCTCRGCFSACSDTSNIFTTVYSDCVCAVCAGADECQSCNNDGKCDPFIEGCACADCAGHPLCP